MFEWLFAPVLKFFGSLGQPEEDERMETILRPYVGKKLWLAVSPDRSKVLFSAPTPGKLEEKASAIGVQDFISLRAPRKLRRL